MTELFKELALLGDVWVLWLLVFASLLSVAVMADRWRAFRRGKLDFKIFMLKLNSLLENGDFKGAGEYASRFPGLEARVSSAGLEAVGKGPASVEEAMLACLTLERSRLEKGLVILATLGNNAPFVGLFGTVLGIIKAFNDLALNGTAGASVVMAGISSALIATAFGILVAIPAVVANNMFHSCLKRRCDNAGSVIHLFQSYLRASRPGEGSVLNE